MTVYVDEIIVSFKVKDSFKYEYKLNGIKYCPICKICRGIQCFRSLNKKRKVKTNYGGDA